VEKPQEDGLSRRPLLEAAGLVGGVTILSRILGLVRDMVLAAALGATRVADVFWIAFELPNLMRRVLGEGSLSAFVVPIFAKERLERGEEAGWRFASNALTVLAAFSLGVTALGMLAARPLFSVFGFGYFQRGDAEAIALGTQLTSVMFPFVTLLALSSILMGLCHAIRHFLMPALGPVVMNVTMIAAAWLFHSQSDSTVARALAVSVVVSGVLRAAIMLRPLMRDGFRYRFSFQAASPAMRELYRMMLPAFFGMAVAQVNVSLSRAFATKLGEGFVPCLMFSQRLFELPLGIVASSLATAILPQLAHDWLAGRRAELERLVRLAFRIVFILFVPATVGLIALGLPIVRLLLERGDWTFQSSLWAYQALVFYAPSLVILGMLKILTPVFYAQRDVRTPVVAGVVSLVVNIVLNLTVIFIEPVRVALGHAGLALATTFGVLANALVLMAVLEKRGLALWNGRLTRTAFGTLAAACGMGVAAWVLWEKVWPLAGIQGRTVGAVALLTIIAVSGAFYFLLAWALRVPNVTDAFGFLLRKNRSLKNR
jgi:putative peptidoglycan lipid II flippase